MKHNVYVKYTSLMLLLSVLSMSSGCRRVSAEPRCIDPKPKLEPLQPEILQLMQPDSTQLSKRAEDWYENSGQLLDSVKTN